MRFGPSRTSNAPAKRLYGLLALTLACLAAPPALAGTYSLTVEEATVDVGGERATKMTINGGVPGPTLHFKEGEDATITVTNKTDEPTSVHWHGILLPGMMDGSPGFNGFMAIKPGAGFTYTFHIRQSGTYWYHSHSGTQDQSVLGAIVIDPKEPAPVRADRDYVVLLGDATPEDSDQVLRNLKADSGYYNRAQRTVGDFFRDAGKDGLESALSDRADWGDMRMDPTDLADVTGYTFLVNGKPPAGNETFLFRKGERVRLRLINGSAMTLFDVRIPGLKMTVVASDGQDVVPVTIDQIRMGVAERYDVIVEPSADVAYTLFAEAIDRTGYARATIAAREGAEGPIPAMSPRSILTMEDMGGAHGGGHDMAGMEHGAMDHGGDDAKAGGACPMGHSGMEGMAMDHSMMDHGAMAGCESKMNHDGMNHGTMDHGSMDHGAMDHGSMDHGSMDHGSMDHGSMDHGSMDHGSMAMDHGTPKSAVDGSLRPLGWSSGVPDGLQRLDYAQLKALRPNADTGEPTRTVTVRLTGNMERYLWTLNDAKFGDAEPIKVRYGERVRLTFVNETMMAHPIHLHGQFFQLENGQDGFKPLKDTVIVPPGKTVSVVLTAREVGAWPLHCHLLYHMVAGMMTRFVVEPPGATDVTPDNGSITMSPHDPGGHAMHGAMGHGGGQ